MRDLSPDEEAFLKEGVSQYLPAVRALGGFVDYWTKSYGNWYDLHENVVMVTDAAVRSTDFVCLLCVT